MKTSVGRGRHGAVADVAVSGYKNCVPIAYIGS